MKRHVFFKVLGVVFLLVALLPGADASRAREGPVTPAAGDYVAGEVLVKFRPGVTPVAVSGGMETGVASLDALVRQYGVKAAEPLFAGVGYSIQGLERIYKLSLPVTVDVLAVVGDLSADASVEYVEPNYLYSVLVEPDDPHFSQEWGLHNTGQTGGEDDADIDAPEAWDIITGTSEVMVAVVDSGVDYTHEDLDDGRVRSDIDQDYVNDDDDAMDDFSHGTHVAGTIAAETNNGTGVAGVMWQAQILPLKVCSWIGFCPADAIASGIRYAADQGADVINMSLGGTCSQTTADAVNYAYFERGVIIVAASGNNAGGVSYPAKHAPVIAVGATDHDDDRAAFSNFGDELDVVAPGVDIFSTILNDGYYAFSGTSMASPHVAGVVGLLLAQRPDLSPGQVREILRQSADDLGESGFDVYYGYGRVNAYQALQTATPDEPPPPEEAVCTGCAAGAATLGSPARVETLQLLWRLYVEVLAPSPVGQEYAALFFHHSPEVSGILFRDAMVRAAAQDVLGEMRPIFYALLGEGEDIVLTAGLVTQVADLTDAISAQAGPELRDDLQTHWERVTPERFAGMTATEAWAAMQRLHRLYLPIVLASR